LPNKFLHLHFQCHLFCHLKVQPHDFFVIVVPNLSIQCTLPNSSFSPYSAPSPPLLPYLTRWS
jgi:hypothetical protein